MDRILVAKNKKELKDRIEKIRFEKGPILLKIEIMRTMKIGKRINIKPTGIKSRFQESLIS